jgi:hypothetical protein
MKDAWSATANFLVVYVREAHACDEWETKDNVGAGIKVLQPVTDEARLAAATRFVEGTGISIPVVVDGVDDAVGTAWGAWPERLYVLDAAGRVIHRGGMGPFEFHPEEIPVVLAGLAPGARRWPPEPGVSSRIRVRATSTNGFTTENAEYAERGGERHGGGLVTTRP